MNIAGFFSLENSDYHKALKEAARGMTRVQEMDYLFKLIAYMVSARMKIRHVALFYFDKRIHAYVLKVKRGNVRLQQGLKIDALSPIVELMKGRKEIIIKKDIERTIRERSRHIGFEDQKFTRILPRVKAQAEEIGASVCVPCFGKGGLLGFL
ncbi:MAG: hypothetical protein ABIH01_00850, partial [Candidatus Omnitrophota bacterium]